MTRIVFLDRATIAPSISLPKPAFEHQWIEFDKTAPHETAERVMDADIVITNKVRIDAEILEAAPKLRLVAVAATGYDCVDITACAKRDVTVCNIRGYSVNTVPEHVFTLLLALKRSLLPFVTEVRDGVWSRAGQFCYFSNPIGDLAGTTMGIVGGGAIGTKVAGLAKAFGMEVVYAARPGDKSCSDRVEFSEFCARSDVISLHCPLNDTTRGLLGADAFAAMRRCPIIINTARGALIDLAALRAALATGQISGAGIDVADREPPSMDDILIELSADPRVLVTPHIAWASSQAQQALSGQLGDVLESFHRGHPINRLTT